MVNNSNKNTNNDNNINSTNNSSNSSTPQGRAFCFRDSSAARSSSSSGKNEAGQCNVKEDLTKLYDVILYHVMLYHRGRTRAGTSLVFAGFIGEGSLARDLHGRLVESRGRAPRTRSKLLTRGGAAQVAAPERWEIRHESSGTGAPRCVGPT